MTALTILRGMTATVNSIKEYFSGMKVNLIMGVMADKDYKKNGKYYKSIYKSSLYRYPK